MRNPLLDKAFIEALDKSNQRELYAKIVSYTTDNKPIEEIQGKISQGTLSIDGTSAVRRTCSLTIIADRININEYYWSFTTRFKLYIGLKIPKDLKEKYQFTQDVYLNKQTGEITLSNSDGFLYKDYPDIIWFPQGMFLITDFKLLMNTNGTDNIYITGKDKMALLNGEIGGTFPHATDVGTIEEKTYDDAALLIDTVKTPLTIKQMITDMVHKYGGESFHNIIVNDLDDNALIMLDYHGDNDIYLFRNTQSGLIENVVFDGDVIRYDRQNKPIKISEIKNYDTLMTDYVATNAQKIKSTNNLLDETYYTVIKCSYGSVVGYRTTDWTYPSKGGELVMDLGTTVKDALDKICAAFDNIYEYFYDIDGKFVFQKKLTYVNTSWNNLINTWELNKEKELERSVYAESSKLVSQVEYNFVGNTMTTMYNNNPNISNLKNDYAIWGKKKSSLESQENSIHMRVAIDEKPEYYKAFDGTIYTSDVWDWRELIYQMAKDYYDHNHEDEFELKLYNNNKPNYKLGKTGYETYYEDMLGFWRLLYNPESSDNEVYVLKRDENETEEDFNLKKYWNREVFDNPAQLTFWFDFFNGKTTDLGKYSVRAIGDRTKTINNDEIKAITYGEIPNVIYISQKEYNNLKIAKLLNDGYTYIILPEGMEEYFDSRKKQKSAQDQLDELVYQYAYCNESITITSIPIYHLEPNMRISAYDEKAKINGEYIVNKIVISLAYNGTMQIMANKAPIRLF